MAFTLTRSLQIIPRHLNAPLVRYKSRSPPRVFGRTKTQWLDSLQRSNALICAVVALGVFPVTFWWIHRYMTILKPEKEAFQKRQIEDLLSEGKASQ